MRRLTRDVSNSGSFRDRPLLTCEAAGQAKRTMNPPVADKRRNYVEKKLQSEVLCPFCGRCSVILWSRSYRSGLLIIGQEHWACDWPKAVPISDSPGSLGAGLIAAQRRGSLSIQQRTVGRSVIILHIRFPSPAFLSRSSGCAFAYPIQMFAPKEIIAKSRSPSFNDGNLLLLV